MGQNNYVQQTHRFISDNGSLTAASLIGSQGGNYSFDVDSNIRIRFIIQETGNAKAETLYLNLYYNHNGAGWVAAATSSTVILSSTSTYVTDGDAITTQRLTFDGGLTTWVNGFYCDDNDQAHSLSLKYQYTEVEFCIQINGSLVNNDDTIELRVYDTTAPLDAYTVTPTLTAIKGLTPISGTLSETLDNVTAAGTGVSTIEGTLSETLDNVTGAGTGKVDITGSLAATLDNVTGAGTGTVVNPPATGTLSETLEDFTVSGSGDVYVEGTLSETLDNITAAGEGGVGWPIVAKASVAGTNQQSTTGIDTTGADFLLVVIPYWTNLTQYEDSEANTWTWLTEYGSSSPYLRIGYCNNPTTSSNHTFTITSSYGVIMFYAFSGLDGWVLDQENGALDTTNTGNITPSEAGTLLAAFASIGGGGGSSTTVTSPFEIEDAIPYSGGVNPGGVTAFDNLHYLTSSISATFTDVYDTNNELIIASFKPGAGAIEGTLSETLDNITGAGTGQVDVTGQAAITLDDITGAGTGAVDITGSLAETLDNITGSGQGQVDITGSLAETLDNVTVTGSGVVGTPPAIGTLNQTLENVTVTGSGQVPAVGTLAATLDDITAAGAGTVEIQGQLSETLDQITGSGAGSVDVTGQAAITLADITGAGTGAVNVSGSLTETLENVTVAGSGVVGNPPAIGTLNVTLGNVTVTGTGEIPLEGSLDQTLGNVTVSGSGQVDVTGSLSATLDNVIGSGAGQVDITGSLDQTLEPVTCWGFIGIISQGTLNVTLDDITAAGAGSLRGYIQLEYELEIVTGLEYEVELVTQIEQDVELTTVIAVDMEIGIDS